MNRTLKLILIIAAVVLAVVLCSILLINVPKNNAIGYEEKISTMQSAIKVQEKRRADLIPNLVDCVKAYDEHEYETLVKVIEARSGSASDEDGGDTVSTEVQNALNLIIERYPELKSNENYRSLMDELSITENLIAANRNAYNSSVLSYRRYTKRFPVRLFLDITGYECKDFTYLDFDADSLAAPKNLFKD